MRHGSSNDYDPREPVRCGLLPLMCQGTGACCAHRTAYAAGRIANGGVCGNPSCGYEKKNKAQVTEGKAMAPEFGRSHKANCGFRDDPARWSPFEVRIARSQKPLRSTSAGIGAAPSSRILAGELGPRPLRFLTKNSNQNVSYIDSACAQRKRAVCELALVPVIHNHE